MMTIDPRSVIDSIRSRPDFDRVGMILTHLGIVRGVSRDGRKVTGIDLAVDRDRLADVVAEQKQRSGIVDIRVEITDRTRLAVGDEIMMVVVAGDVRENVLAAMAATIDAIKSTVTRKIEHF